MTGVHAADEAHALQEGTRDEHFAQSAGRRQWVPHGNTHHDDNGCCGLGCVCMKGRKVNSS